MSIMSLVFLKGPGWEGFEGQVEHEKAAEHEELKRSPLWITERMTLTQDSADANLLLAALHTSYMNGVMSISDVEYA